MIHLTDPEKEKLIRVLIQYGRLDTKNKRENFLEEAGLSKFYASLPVEAITTDFCRELVRRLIHPSALTEKGEYAFPILLHYLRTEVLPGHPELITFIDHLLSTNTTASNPVSDFEQTSYPSLKPIEHDTKKHNWVPLLILVGILISIVVTIIALWPSDALAEIIRIEARQLDLLAAEATARADGSKPEAVTDYRAEYNILSTRVSELEAGLTLEERELLATELAKTPTPITSDNLPVSTVQSFEIAISTQISPGVPSMGAGNIEVPGAEDLYTFMAEAGQTIFIETSDLDGDIFFLPLTLVDATGTELYSHSLDDDSGAILIQNTGLHTIRIGDPDTDRDNMGTYKLKIWEVPKPITFEIAIGTQISQGVPGIGAGNIEVPSAEDLYTFMAEAGQTIFIQTSDFDGDVYFLPLTLVDATGTELYSGALDYDSGVVLIQNTGLYTIRVGDPNAFRARTGTYKLKIWEVPKPITFEIAIGTQISPGAPSMGAGNIEVPGGEDLYTFMAEAGQTIFIQTSDVNNFIISLPLTLVDATGTELYSGILEADSGAILIQNTGLHTIHIGDPNAFQTRTGTYSFKVVLQ